MRKSGIIFVLFIITANLFCLSEAGQDQQKSPTLDFNTFLMRATVLIRGEGSQGTAFFVGRPRPKEPEKLRYTLVTAAHVLEKMQGEIATLFFRRETGPGKWDQLPLPLKIRDGKHILWTKHPEVDIAVMYIGVPEDASTLLISQNMLGDDTLLAKYEVHPGDELRVLGYPFGLGTGQGLFPVLRSGRIASYPLLPTRTTKTFLLDFPVFPGNSGGPVYIDFTGARIYGGAIMQGTAFRFIMGLVSKEQRLTEKVQEFYATREQSYSLGLAEVIHASLIKETIELLPLP